MNNPNASWLYRRCLALQQPSTNNNDSSNATTAHHDKALPLARSALAVILEAPLRDGEWINKKKEAQCQMALFRLAKDRDFVIGVMGRMAELKEDGGLSEESLMAAAAAAAASVDDGVAADNDDCMEDEEDDVKNTNTADSDMKDDANDTKEERLQSQSQSIPLITNQTAEDYTSHTFKSSQMASNIAVASQEKEQYELQLHIDSNELRRASNCRPRS